MILLVAARVAGRTHIAPPQYCLSGSHIKESYVSIVWTCCAAGIPPRLPPQMVHKLKNAHLLIWPLTNPDILSHIAKLANGCKLVIWFDFDWIINRVRSSRLVSDMNLIIRDVQGWLKYTCISLSILCTTLQRSFNEETASPSSSAVAYNHLVSVMNLLL